ncbi:MAG: BON domain-containing protein [Terrimicrobiaceae bacterium]|nr:BON domain-containing protein [Terrimicrobiaceae bacterium]
MKRIIPVVLTALGLLAAGAHAQDQPSRENTGRNERDRSGETKTPTDQSQEPADLDLTARIRQAVVADDSLSALAKNSKIITKDGQVTLRGPVKNDSEIQKIADHAEAAGAKDVNNQLEAK